MIRRLRAQAPASPTLVGTRTGAMPVAISRTSWSTAGSYSHTDPRSARRTCLAAFTTSDSMVLRSNGAASLLVTARIASMSDTESRRLLGLALMRLDHNRRSRSGPVSLRRLRSFDRSEREALNNIVLTKKHQHQRGQRCQDRRSGHL